MHYVLPFAGARAYLYILYQAVILDMKINGNGVPSLLAPFLVMLCNVYGIKLQYSFYMATEHMVSLVPSIGEKSNKITHI